MRKQMIKIWSVTNLVMVMLAASGYAVQLDDNFDATAVNTSIWTIGGDVGEVWVTNSTLHMNDANGAYPRPYVRSRGDNGYSWASGRFIIDWDAGGRYAGLISTNNYAIRVRKDIKAGQWTLSIEDADGTRNYNLGSSYDPTVGWHWELIFSNGTVIFKGKKYTSSNWEIDNTYTYNISGPFEVEAWSYTTTAEFGRMALIPPDTKDMNDLFDGASVNTNFWEVGGDAGEVWVTNSILHMNDANSAYPRPYVISRSDNDYWWTTNRAVIDWTSGGRYAGLMTIDGSKDLLIRKDITAGRWTLEINDSTGTHRYTIGSSFNPTVGWHWEIFFGNGSVTFKGRRYTVEEWDVDNTYSYNIDGALTLQAHSYNTTAQFDRLAVMPVPPPQGTLIIVQ